MSKKKITKLAYQTIKLINQPGYYKYLKALNSVETIQRRKLKKLLSLSKHNPYFKKYKLEPKMSWEQFNNNASITEYSDWHEIITSQKKSGRNILNSSKCQRYQPTSGSTDTMKWIPYSNLFLSELNNAISPLAVDLLKKNKKLMAGQQYWSLSWIPTDLRKEITNKIIDDTKLLPQWKQMALSLTMAVPNEVSYAKTSESSMMATIAYLTSAKDLTFISVWSPTFALTLFEQMKLYKSDLIEILSLGNWGRWQKNLSFLPPPKSLRTASILNRWDGTIDSDFFISLWPNLAMVSSWDTSTSKYWAHDLKKLLPQATFQGKGLWATEAVVTIPFENQYPLAVTSHFYEFLDLQDNKIYPAWNLKKTQIVSPLLTTGSGFFRYKLNDKLKVVDFLHDCPCFEFMGRNGDIDMVGEKMSPEIAMLIIDKISKQFQVRVINLMAVLPEKNNLKKPYYLLLCEGDNTTNISPTIAEQTEKFLCKSFHYNLARDQKLLEHTKVYLKNNAMEVYQKHSEKKNIILGNTKIEPLTICHENKLPINSPNNY